MPKLVAERKNSGFSKRKIVEYIKQEQSVVTDELAKEKFNLTIKNNEGMDAIAIAKANGYTQCTDAIEKEIARRSQQNHSQLKQGL